MMMTTMRLSFLFNCKDTFLLLLLLLFFMTSTKTSAMVLSSGRYPRNTNCLENKNYQQHSSSSSPPTILPQTEQDRYIENRFQKHGILMGPDGGRKIQISTTDKSVGGRGVFWTPSPSLLQADTKFAGVARQGDILAHIPGHLVLLPSNLQGSYPCLFHSHNSCYNDEHDDRYTWQTILTTYAWKALNDRRTTGLSSSTSTKHFWQDWIKSWDGNDDGNDDSLLIPKLYEDYTSKGLEDLARLAHAKPEEVRELIDVKYETFEKDWDAVRSLIINNEDDRGDDVSDHQKMKRQFGKLYSLVLSRTTNLGPDWGNQLGVIPLHDMINHPPSGRDANVELFCIGDIRSMIGDDNLNMLLRPLLTAPQLLGEVERPTFMDRDFVIAARQRIDPYEELFLSYKNGIDDMDGKQQLWLLLQYGFPLCQT